MKPLSAHNLFSPTILLAVALMAVIVMMILPMPAWVLDVGLAISFGMAILIFTVTLESGNGWQSGIKSAVRFAPIIPASTKQPADI